MDVETECICDCSKRKERVLGGAGELLRTILDEHGMISLSSWRDSRDTFFGNLNQSLLDHIFVPRAFLLSKLSAGPLFGMGKKLQLVQKKSIFDHVPVHCTFNYLLAHPCPQARHHRKLNFLMASPSRR